MPLLTDDPHSDLWYGNSERDWSGRDLDCCPTPRPEDRDLWADRAARLHSEDENRSRLARAAHRRATALRRSQP